MLVCMCCIMLSRLTGWHALLSTCHACSADLVSKILVMHVPQILWCMFRDLVILEINSRDSLVLDRAVFVLWHVCYCSMPTALLPIHPMPTMMESCFPFVFLYSYHVMYSLCNCYALSHEYSTIALLVSTSWYRSTRGSPSPRLACQGGTARATSCACTTASSQSASSLRRVALGTPSSQRARATSRRQWHCAKWHAR